MISIVCPKGADTADDLTQTMPKVLTVPSLRCIPVKAAEPVGFIPTKVSDLLPSIQKKSLNDSELQMLRELIN
jgi:hypothetical protein